MVAVSRGFVRILRVYFFFSLLSPELAMVQGLLIDDIIQKYNMASTTQTAALVP